MLFLGFKSDEIVSWMMTLSDERPEDLYQRMVSFIEDSLLTKGSQITHHGEGTLVDEFISPTLENFCVLYWLKLVNPELPRLVKQRYATELRTRTLASIKPEISLALDSLLDEIRSSNDVKAFRSNVYKKPASSKLTSKLCVLCKMAKRPYNHFLSQCVFLPEEDKKYMAKSRACTVDDVEC